MSRPLPTRKIPIWTDPAKPSGHPRGFLKLADPLRQSAVFRQQRAPSPLVDSSTIPNVRCIPAGPRGNRIVHGPTALQENYIRTVNGAMRKGWSTGARCGTDKNARVSSSVVKSSGCGHHANKGKAGVAEHDSDVIQVSSATGRRTVTASGSVKNGSRTESDAISQANADNVRRRDKDTPIVQGVPEGTSGRDGSWKVVEDRGRRLEGYIDCWTDVRYLIAGTYCFD
ncbi:MAG: hypothetical protein M1827_006603 [Pycnora praestabilis]|nr:MAG: hypothetical protein M1827_006603 [Pycnora praestabilis]